MPSQRAYTPPGGSKSRGAGAAAGALGSPRRGGRSRPDRRCAGAPPTRKDARGPDRRGRGLLRRRRPGRPHLPRTDAAHGAALRPAGDPLRLLRLRHAPLPQPGGGRSGHGRLRADPGRPSRCQAAASRLRRSAARADSAARSGSTGTCRGGTYSKRGRDSRCEPGRHRGGLRSHAGSASARRPGDGCGSTIPQAPPSRRVPGWYKLWFRPKERVKAPRTAHRDARNPMKTDVFGARASIDTGFGRATLYRLDALEKAGVAPGLARLPFSIRVLLEAVAPQRRRRAGHGRRRPQPRRAGTRPPGETVELPFMPARVLLQDFTGVPARGGPGGDARRGEAAGRRPEADQPARPGRPGDRPLRAGGRVRQRRTRCEQNAELEFERNRERYEFLRWGQKAFRNFRVVPPATGIVHQVNLEYLAQRRADARAATAQTVGVPRHAGRHRLAHHHDQRPGRGGLGRRRHRGRGGDARPAALHADAAGGRLPAHRPAPRGRHRHRPGADRHPDAAQEGRGRTSSSSSTAPGSSS